MARRVFFSFHFDDDFWRASQVRQIGSVVGNAPVADNQWEKVKRGGSAAIQRWIDGQLVGKSCTIVLIGSRTAERQWVKYEIERSWQTHKGLLGVRVHRLKDSKGHSATRGQNPFDAFELNGRRLSSVVPVFDPSGFGSNGVYADIARNIARWVEQGIAVRAKYR